MKIVRIKTGKAENKKDMFVVLCLIQSVAAVLIVFMIFAVSRINQGLFSDMKEDIARLFSLRSIKLFSIISSSTRYFMKGFLPYVSALLSIRSLTVWNFE